MNFICTSCGATAIKILGKCPSCGKFGTMTANETAKHSRKGTPAQKTSIHTATTGQNERITTDIAELDRVFGDGGVLAGSYALLGGEPGVGKSTLALSVCDAFLKAGKSVVYVSGEESKAQIAARAARLKIKNIQNSDFSLISSTSLENIETHLRDADFAVVDSMQTLTTDEHPFPGTPATVRDGATRLMQIAKQSSTTILLIGHVTKDGNVAGPQTLAHLVDIVLLLEGNETSELRILRALKNRFGSTDEVGMFEMTSTGMHEVKNPTTCLIENREHGNPGSVVTVALEGKRPILMEVQALSVRTNFGYPKRVATGMNANRLSLLLAVLERHAGIKFSEHDVYVNVVGGVNLPDRGGDLAVCLALLSTRKDIALPPTLTAWGEVGLGGEIRPCAKEEKRENEAKANGFTEIISRKKIKNVKNLLSLLR